MISVLKVASYLTERYLRVYGQKMDEMKLHKLLYFTQKECIIQLGEPMFEEEMRAWKYGPVVPCVRQAYKNDELHEKLTEEDEKRYQAVFDALFEMYAGKSSWSLVTHSHCEKSWKRARVGYGEYESSDVPMMVEDIYEDAKDAIKRRAEVEAYKKFYQWLEDKKSPLLEKLPHVHFD